MGLTDLKRLLQYLQGSVFGLRCRPSPSPVLTGVGGVGRDPLGTVVLLEGAGLAGEWLRSRGGGGSMGWTGIIGGNCST